MKVRSIFQTAHPAVLVLGTFAIAIAFGCLVLKLPISTVSGSITWIDSLFTATSAVCVTGLIVVDTGSYFTVFGQCVILALIQVGGLGVMTISVCLFHWVGRRIAFRHRMTMQTLFAHTPREDILGVARSVLVFTLSAESVGALVLLWAWSGHMPLAQATYSAIFHSVSAFCNAGFSLYSDSMMGYRDGLAVNATVCVLIVVGGIGFPVLHELGARLRPSGGVRRRRVSVHAKSVLVTSAVLILAGAGLFAFLERERLAAYDSHTTRILVSLFQSITCRTAGFNTVDTATLGDGALALMIVLMFIGASPGSCGGGVKTTTLAVLAAFALSRIGRMRRANLFRKSVPTDTLDRSVALVLVSLTVIALVFFALLVVQGSAQTPEPPRGPFLAYLFETVSAFGTVGLSMGVTAGLSPIGKCLIVVTMLVGRVGVLTFAYIVVGGRPVRGIEYAEEDLMIG